MLDGARESLAHGIVALLVVLALERAWRLSEPGHRLQLELLALAAPTAGTALLAWLAPLRRLPPFEAEHALLRTRAWSEIDVAGVRLDVLLLAAGGVLAGVLLGRDLLQTARGLARGRALPDDHEAVGRVRSRLVPLLRPGESPPRLVVIDGEQSVLACQGTLRPRIMVSTGAARRLQDAELDAVLAHEMAHVRHRDVPFTWALLALRTLAFWNPAAQVAGRRAAWELERRADAEAAAWCGADALGAAHGRMRVTGPLRAAVGEPAPPGSRPLRTVLALLAVAAALAVVV